MTDILRPHERLDDLVLDGMKLIQRDDQFCFSIDTVLLAHFGPVLRGPALDLGTGTAAIPLILTARGATDVTGVELNPVKADIAATLDDVMEAVKYALKYRGRFRMVHITERLTDILESMRRHGVEPKALQMIHGRPDKKAKLFLVEGVRGGSAGLEIWPPLIVHEADGSYSRAVLDMYGKE